MRVVTVTSSFKDDIARRGIDRGKIDVVTNGVRSRPLPARARRAGARAPGTASRDKFVVLYCGAHGISHALLADPRGGARMRATDDVRFVFVGEGAEKDALVGTRARARA